MTREEALQQMKIIRNDCFIISSNKDIQAFEMAIEALKVEPCTDAISRQTVLDTLEKWWNCKSESDDIYEIIKAIPPVTPAEKVGRWIISPNDCFVHCSECELHGGKGIYKHYRWCPNCGVKMASPTGAESEDKE